MNSTRDSGLFERVGPLLFLLVGAGPWLVAVSYLSGGASSTMLTMVPVLLAALLFGLKVRSVLFESQEATERYPAIR